MNQLLRLFTSETANIIGWTLLHSLWQALIIVLFVRLLLRFNPRMSSNIRYSIALGGLVTLCISSCITAFIISNTISPAAVSILDFQPISIATYNNLTVGKEHFMISNTMAWIQQQIPVLVGLWVIGAILFAFRIMGAWIYITTIKLRATILYNHWTDRLIEMAHELHIDRPVMLASSTAITVPMVIGNLRPLIIVPSLMFTGFTPVQIEAILLHEIAHIRRNDYFINIIQSLIEALFFFNPFMWMLSSMIRTEREYCCDDIVLARNINPFDYAHALHQLQEVRMSSPGLAMSLATEKYALLNRIKRIMEKSVTKYPKWERFIPILLLIIGFTSVAFTSVNHSDHKKPFSHSPVNYTTSDTVVRPSETPSRPENDATKNESVNEEYILDLKVEPPEPVLTTPPPPIEIFDILIAPMEPMSFPSMPPMKFQFSWDSLPEKMIQFKQFEFELNKTFEESFNLEFNNLHINELNEIAQRLDEELLRLNQSFKDIARVDMEMIEKQVHQQMKQQELIEIQLQRLAVAEERIKHIEQHNAQMHEEQARLKLWQENNERALIKMEAQLIRDGYLKKGEKIKSIQWSGDMLKINNMLIKEADAAKYKQLYEPHQIKE